MLRRANLQQGFHFDHQELQLTVRSGLRFPLHRLRRRGGHSAGGRRDCLRPLGGTPAVMGSGGAVGRHPTTAERTQRLKAQAFGLGFDLVGITTLGEPATRTAFDAWLDAGLSPAEVDHFEASRKRAEKGEAEGQSMLGFCYFVGQGVKQDYAEAVRWYRKAAEQGDSYAQCNLGACYENGEGVMKDLSTALHWYRLAAAQGDADATAKAAELDLAAAAQPTQATGIPPSTPPVLTSVCGNCGLVEGSGGVVLRPCSRCKGVKYCGTACQSLHWKVPGGHKASCKPLGS